MPKLTIQPTNDGTDRFRVIAKPPLPVRLITDHVNTVRGRHSWSKNFIKTCSAQVLTFASHADAEEFVRLCVEDGIVSVP